MPITPQEFAEQWKLQPTTSNGEPAWCGPNPFPEEGGAESNGFLYYQNGTAYDRSIERRYTSWEIAKLANIPLLEYTPNAKFVAENPDYKPNPNRPKPPLRAPAKPKEKTAKEPKTFDTRTLEQRGFLPKTLSFFKISSSKDHLLGLHYDYPTYNPDGSLGCKRRKWINPILQTKREPDKNPAKYWWLRSESTNTKPILYNHSALIPKETIWMVNGEPSVWACHQNGVLAVSPLGEKRKLQEFLNIVLAAGVTELHYVPDNDKTGYSAALKLLDLAAEINLKLIVHTWHKPPTELKQGYDVCDLMEECGANKLDFKQMLNDLPVGLPKPIETKNINEKPTFGAANKETFEMPLPKGEKTADAQAETLLELLELMGLKLYNTSDEIALMTLEKDTRRETIIIGSAAFKYLLDEIWSDYGAPMLKKDAIELTSRVLEGRAIRKGVMLTMSPRIQGNGDGTKEEIYIDLNDGTGSVVEINKRGWRVLPYTDKAFFRQTSGMLPLPAPVHTPIDHQWKVWEDFRELMALGDEQNFIMAISWVLGCLRPPKMPYAALCVSGFQNSGKTEKCRMLRALFDPHIDDMGSVPETNRDLAIQANNRFVLGYDNLSGISAATSDALCRIATKGGFSTRKLHADRDEIIFSAIRPLLINGISEYMGRDDFQRRCMFVSIPKMEKRVAVRTIWQRFHAMAPKVLGLLLDCVVAAIQNSENEDILSIDAGEGFPDLVQWISGAEMAGVVPWADGEFLSIYQEAQQVAAEAGLDALLPATFSRFARYLRESGESGWEGNATELFEALQPHAAVILLGESLYQSAGPEEQIKLLEKGREKLSRSKDFPSNFQYLGREVRRLAPRLAQNKIFDVEFPKKNRHIRLKLFTQATIPLPLAPDEDDPFNLT